MDASLSSAIATAIATLAIGACSFSGAPAETPDEEISVDAGAVDGEAPIVDAAPQPACVDLPQGALAWWDAEIVGDDLLDAHDAADITEVEPTIVPGKVQSAVALGADQRILINPAPTPAEFTIEGWIRRDGDDRDYMTIYGDGNTAGLFVLDHRVVYFDLRVGNSNVVLGATELALERYYHVAVTYDQNNNVRAYLNGVVDGSGTAAGVVLPPVSRMGGLNNIGDGQNFLGQIDELTIYGRVLAESEIASIVEAGELGKCKE